MEVLRVAYGVRRRRRRGQVWQSTTVEEVEKALGALLAKLQEQIDKGLGGTSRDIS